MGLHWRETVSYTHLLRLYKVPFLGYGIGGFRCLFPYPVVPEMCIRDSVYLVDVYDKSDFSTVSVSILKKIMYRS